MLWTQWLHRHFEVQTSAYCTATPQTNRYHNSLLWLKKYMYISEPSSDEGKQGEHVAAPECEGGGKREIPVKTRWTTASPCTIPTYENTGNNPVTNRAQFVKLFAAFSKLLANDTKELCNRHRMLVCIVMYTEPVNSLELTLPGSCAPFSCKAVSLTRLFSHSTENSQSHSTYNIGRKKVIIYIARKILLVNKQLLPDTLITLLVGRLTRKLLSLTLRDKRLLPDTTVKLLAEWLGQIHAGRAGHAETPGLARTSPVVITGREGLATLAGHIGEVAGGVAGEGSTQAMQVNQAWSALLQLLVLTTHGEAVHVYRDGDDYLGAAGSTLPGATLPGTTASCPGRREARLHPLPLGPSVLEPYLHLQSVKTGMPLKIWEPNRQPSGLLQQTKFGAVFLEATHSDARSKKTFPFPTPYHINNCFAQLSVEAAEVSLENTPVDGNGANVPQMQKNLGVTPLGIEPGSPGANHNALRQYTHVEGREEWTGQRGRPSGQSAIVKERGQLLDQVRRRLISGRRGQSGDRCHRRSFEAARALVSHPGELGSLDDALGLWVLSGIFPPPSLNSGAVPVPYSWCSAGMKGLEKWEEVLEKTHRPAASSDTISTYEYPGVTQLGLSLKDPP
ncbi:hypothetical protein PR048_000768 [Dryococelus australis]|uniref:Uncharacterized protein n=1 Tax=Dryococelus australis TaxID=614101 RepID=A0ABQ9IFK2_9NEOP|nr:hypothetical protein PR048_000768 [Dryococelus australis]